MGAYKNVNQQKQGQFIWKLCKKLILMILVVITTAGGLKMIEASSVITAVNQVNVVVNYENETIQVFPGTSGSTRFYISRNNRKSWDLIDPYGPIDISTLLSTKEVSVYFMGNKDTIPVEVKLEAADSSLVTEYKIFNGEGRILLSGTSLPIEYRNGTYGQWKTVYNNMINTTPYEMYGTTLYIRTMATQQKRAGKIINVKVPKKPTAPSVKLDGSKLSFTGLKAEQTQYRVDDNWVDFKLDNSTTNTLDLKSLLGKSLPNNTPIPAGIIEFRTKSTDKKVASAVKVIEVPAQPNAPANVQLNGTTLTVQDSDKRRYYEYTVLSGASTLNLNTAKWTSFTSAKPAIVKNAAIGDRVCVRIKSTADPSTKNVIPASTYRELIITSISPSIK